MYMKIEIKNNQLIPYLTLFNLVPIPVIFASLAWGVIALFPIIVMLYGLFGHFNWHDAMIALFLTLSLTAITIALGYYFFRHAEIPAISKTVYTPEFQKRIGQELRVMKPGLGIMLNHDLAKSIAKIERSKEQEDVELARMSEKQDKVKKLQEEQQEYQNQLNETRQMVNQIVTRE